MKEDLQLMYLTNSSILLFLLLFCGCDTIYENVLDVITATQRNMCPCPASGPPRHGRVITPWPYQCTSGGERRETMTGCYDRTFPTPLRDQAMIFILVHLERPAK